jgi:hypothetical protein
MDGWDFGLGRCGSKRLIIVLFTEHLKAAYAAIFITSSRHTSAAKYGHPL